MPAGLLTGDAKGLVADPDVDVVVELIGGIDPAGTLVESALGAGKPVVTANKELIATHGAALAEMAAGAGVDLLYEAAVAGAIPLIRPLRESLAGERIRRVMGIVNGTTNFILTAMAEDGLSYTEALAEAQRLGFAERDPTADVDGHDAAAKAAILAGWPSGATWWPTTCTGRASRRSTPSTSSFAARLGYVVKLLAVAERVDGDAAASSRRRRCAPEISVRVHPAMVPATHPLASVRGAFNAVFVEGDGARASSCSTGGGRWAAHGLGGARRRDRRRPSPSGGDVAAAWHRACVPGIRPTDELRCAWYLNTRRRRPTRRPGRRRPGLRRPPRVDPLHGAGRARRRGPAHLPHPRGPRGRRSQPRSPSCASSTWSVTWGASCGWSATRKGPDAWATGRASSRRTGTSSR